MYRVIKFQVRNRAGALALTVAALVLGGVLFAFGLLLLLGLVTVGAAIGACLALYHKLTGRVPRALGRRWRASDLDPALEVFPAEVILHDRQGAARPKERLELPGE